MAEMIELVVKTSKRSGIWASQFLYRPGSSGPFEKIQIINGVGTFVVEKGVKYELRWVMMGDPNGSMTVELLRGTTSLEKREGSLVPTDAFDLQV